MFLPCLSWNFQPCSTSIPQQEVLWDQPVDGLFWEEVDVVQATDNFSPHRRLCHGTFADIYRGQRHGEALIFKKLREVSTSCSQNGGEG